MLDILNLQGLEVAPGGATETDAEITITVSRRAAGRECCPHCGSTAIAPNGSRATNYVDTPMRGKPVSVQWQRQRFKCREIECGKTCTDIHDGLHDEFLMTKRLYDWVGPRCLSTTFAAVAQDIGMDERSVRRVFEHWSEAQLATLNFATPKWLGIDEVHLLHAARGVLTNIDQRALIDILPNRNQDTMARRIQLMTDRDRVEVMAMDMWAPYRRVAANLLPQATVVIDKWHVTKYADLGLEKIRKSFRAELSAPMRRRLIKDRFLLLSRGHNLKPEQRMILQTWTHHFPALAAAYEAKEAFYGVYDSSDRLTAEIRFDAWERSLTPAMRAAFKELLSATSNWRDPIFNYFDHRVTNAYTDAINGLIKISNRNGRGYSFPVLRARMLLNRDAVRRERVAKQPPRVGYMLFERSAPTYFAAKPKTYGIDIATMTRLVESGHIFTVPTGFAG